LRSAFAPVLVAVLARGLTAQGLSVTELDVGPLAAWARYDFYGLAAGFALRPRGQGRLALTGAGGAVDGQAALRLEATAQFLVTPGARSGVSPYGGIGVAYMGSGGRRGVGALVTLVGVEAAPGRRRGWFGELGFAGGFRVRLGIRWRQFPPWWS
jgi:hypothetical protein